MAPLGQTVQDCKECGNDTFNVTLGDSTGAMRIMCEECGFNFHVEDWTNVYTEE